MHLAQGTPRWLPAIAILSWVGVAYSCIMRYVYHYHPMGFEVYAAVTMVLAILFTLFHLFFRDPERESGRGVVAPADGKVRYVGKVYGRWKRELGLGRGYNMVSIFMNLHNVHVNRSPVDGDVVSIRHVPGRFALAFSKDSDSNERVIITIMHGKETFKVVLIAGAFARRIVPYVMVGDRVKKGQRISLIRFGSRVDLYMPPPYTPCVKLGQNTRAGVTTIAKRHK